MPQRLHPVHVGLTVEAIVLLSNCIVVELVVGDAGRGSSPAAFAAEALDDAGADRSGRAWQEADGA